MTFDEAFAEIGQFWPGETPFGFGHGAAAGRLAAEFGRAFPPELVTYLDMVVPAQEEAFDTVGNPLCLYGLGRLGVQQPGYNWNPVTNAPIIGWPDSFFLLGDEGTDSVLLDLHRPERGFNLAPQAAAWLFPRMKTWAGPHYSAWCAEFDNA